MGLFSKKAAKVPRAASLQIPDELALRAADQAGSGDHYGALESYGKAVDKIHTMCVVAQPGSRIRQPGAQDQGILDGFNVSLAAVLSANPESAAGASSTVEQTLAYLQQIGGEAGAESGRYFAAIEAIHTTCGR